MSNNYSLYSVDIPLVLNNGIRLRMISSNGMIIVLDCDIKLFLLLISNRFWDLLHIATWYIHPHEWSQHSDFVYGGYLVVFLVLHTTTSSRPTSPPRQSYDDIWPDNGMVQSPQPIRNTSNSPPSSPNKPLQRKGSGSSTPLSPRGSPRLPQKRSNGMKSPSSYYKSSAQHLSFVKEKLSTIIHALSLQDSGTAEHDVGSSGNNFNGGMFSCEIGNNFVDSLGLILGGGRNDKFEV